VFQLTAARKAQLNKLAAIWVAKRCRPLSITETDTELQDIFLATTAGAWKGPCRQTIKKIIFDLSVEVSLPLAFDCLSAAHVYLSAPVLSCVCVSTSPAPARLHTPCPTVFAGHKRGGEGVEVCECASQPVRYAKHAVHCNSAHDT